MRPMRIILLAFVLLQGCALLGDYKPETPAQVMVLAKGTYAGTLTLMTAAAKTGQISDNVIVNRLEPARAAARASLDLAEDLLKVNDPNVMDYVQAALSKVQDFRLIFDALVASSKVSWRLPWASPQLLGS